MYQLCSYENDSVVNYKSSFVLVKRISVNYACMNKNKGGISGLVGGAYEVGLIKLIKCLSVAKWIVFYINQMNT